jgi:hypothetical protein
MRDRIELWMRKAGGQLLIGVIMLAFAYSRQGWWLPFRIFLVPAGLAGVGVGLHETWKMVRGRKSTENESST